MWFSVKTFADNYFYWSNERNATCLTYPNLELVFSTNDDLKVIDAKAEIEELFGEMDWE
ncbi:MAG: hypothetical protein JXA16_02670 [Bacteroidales bacterium]|nr:hypothetical protein [Bacteroidales bacterium]